jgi:hypothetical protein
MTSLAMIASTGLDARAQRRLFQHLSKAQRQVNRETLMHEEALGLGICKFFKMRW